MWFQSEKRTFVTVLIPLFAFSLTTHFSAMTAPNALQGILQSAASHNYISLYF